MFNFKSPTVQMLGRWQPWHVGHTELFKQSDRRKNKPFFYLGIFALCWWVLPSSIKLVTKSGFREFQAPIWELSSRIEDLSNYWGHISDSKHTLIEKGKKISKSLSGRSKVGPSPCWYFPRARHPSSSRIE